MGSGFCLPSTREGAPSKTLQWTSRVPVVFCRVVRYTQPGATSSVFAWERIGRAIGFLGQKLLRIPLMRYVDDYFGVEPTETLEHAMMCVVRLIRALLGASSVANDKVECGPALVVLGVDVSMTQSHYVGKPAKKIVDKCLSSIAEALRTNVLTPGDAQKLAGRLSWANQFIFHRIGRSMLGPIFRKGSCASQNARRAALLFLIK